jgi:hypothetical protein
MEMQNYEITMRNDHGHEFHAIQYAAGEIEAANMAYEKYGNAVIGIRQLIDAQEKGQQ